MSSTLDNTTYAREDSDAFLEEVIQLGMRGLSLKECGDYYGLDPEEWTKKCEDFPIIEWRHNCGKARGIALAGQKLLNEVKSGKVNAIIFYLKTVGNFEAKAIQQVQTYQVYNHEIPPYPVIPLPPIPSDPVEAANVYRDFMQKT